MRPETWPLRLRLILFASGDLAFNLFWQSVMLFLLFYYTDALGLPMRVAAAIFLVASVWDGLANFAAGAYVDRRPTTRGYGAWLMLGSVPLGISFVLTYMPPVAANAAGIAALFAAHILFRTAYAMLNVPYLAMSARISSDSADRAFIAGVRMLLGTVAAIVVALSTVPMGRRLTGGASEASAYLGAAIVFALAATLILLLVGRSYVDAQPAPARRPASIAASLRSLAANRAFVTLNLAMMAMIVAVTVLNKSVLYYFKYFLADESGGQIALAAMGAVSLAAVPAWMLLARPLGTRTIWFVAAGLGIAGMALFAVLDFASSETMRLFLMAMQAAIVGLNFVFWAMLPNTIEYGERTTGLRVEGTAFGLAALLQRVAIGVATAILGLGFDVAGYVPNVAQSAATLAWMRWTIVLVPLAFLLLSCALMAMNPLRRGAHARIMREIGEGAPGGR